MEKGRSMRSALQNFSCADSSSEFSAHDQRICNESTKNSSYKQSAKRALWQALGFCRKFSKLRARLAEGSGQEHWPELREAASMFSRKSKNVNSAMNGNK